MRRHGPSLVNLRERYHHPAVELDFLAAHDTKRPTAARYVTATCKAQRRQRRPVHCIDNVGQASRAEPAHQCCHIARVTWTSPGYRDDILTSLAQYMAAPQITAMGTPIWVRHAT